MRQVDGTEALARAREMRRAPTAAEARLWQHLRSRRLEGVKFRRQMWIGSYIADFASMEARLVVELDGSQHGEAGAYDTRRARALADAGYRTLRFWNNDIMNDLDHVLEAIRIACLGHVPSPSHRFAAGPSLSLAGEGR